MFGGKKKTSGKAVEVKKGETTEEALERVKKEEKNEERLRAVELHVMNEKQDKQDWYVKFDGYYISFEEVVPGYVGYLRYTHSTPAQYKIRSSREHNPSMTVKAHDIDLMRAVIKMHDDRLKAEKAEAKKAKKTNG